MNRASLWTYTGPKLTHKLLGCTTSQIQKPTTILTHVVLGATERKRLLCKSKHRCLSVLQGLAAALLSPELQILMSKQLELGSILSTLCLKSLSHANNFCIRECNLESRLGEQKRKRLHTTSENLKMCQPMLKVLTRHVLP